MYWYSQQSLSIHNCITYFQFGSECLGFSQMLYRIVLFPTCPRVVVAWSFRSWGHIKRAYSWYKPCTYHTIEIYVLLSTNWQEKVNILLWQILWFHWIFFEKILLIFYKPLCHLMEMDSDVCLLFWVHVLSVDNWCYDKTLTACSILQTPCCPESLPLFRSFQNFYKRLFTVLGKQRLLCGPICSLWLVTPKNCLRSVQCHKIIFFLHWITTKLINFAE